MISKHNNGRNEKGQAMVEFAIVMPILFVLVFGIVQFGITFNHYLTLTDAVRAGARQAAVSRALPDPAGAAESRVRSAAAGSLSDANDTSALVVTVTPYDPASGQAQFAQGGDVTVTATYPYSINLLGFVVGGGRLTSQTTERVE
jgi:Flp pilus assembly protein TadG